MVQTYSNNNNIYSVDMMFAYLNIYKQRVSYTKILVSKYIQTLNYKGWGDPQNNLFYSALDVIDNPKKYKNEINRIENSNLNYPIITDGKFIIDGVHRLAKSHMKNKKYIKCYVFDKPLMKKFLINNKGDWDKVDKLPINYYIELFNKRFIK